MTCKAEERELAAARNQKRYVQRHLQQLKVAAEVELLQIQRIYDWGDVRLAEARMRCCDRRLVNAEEALKRCTEKQKQHD